MHDVRPCLARALAPLVLITLSAAAQVPLCCVEGDAGGDRMGWAVGGVVTTGGRSYALFGAPFASGTGAVTVRGYANGSCIAPFPFPLVGSQSGDRFGARIARGIPGQFVVGAPGYDPAPLVDAGAVYTLDAGLGVVLQRVDGATGSEQFGSACAVIGDFDNSGSIDFAGGALTYGWVGCGCNLGDYRGAVRIADTALRYGWSGAMLCCGGCCATGEQLTNAVCEIGDVTGDNVPDFLVGSRRNSRVHVVFWNASGMPPAPEYVRSDTGPSSFGFSVCPLDDLDNDGFRDYAAGAPDAREVRIMSGGGMTAMELGRFVGADAEFGYALAEVGDQDGGGKADLLIGAPGANGGDGAAYLLSVETGNLLGVVRGEYAGERLGSAVARIDDWTGDGRPELAVGAPDADLPPRNGMARTDAGRAVVMTMDLRGVAYGQGCAEPSPCTSGIEPRPGLPRGKAYPGHARFEVGMSEAMPGSQALLFLGPGPLMPPFPLGGIHPCLAPCRLLVIPMAPSPLARATTAATTNPRAGQGYATLPLPIPIGIPVGARLDVQWYVLDPGGNPLVATMTRALTILVGAPGC